MKSSHCTLKTSTGQDKRNFKDVAPSKNPIFPCESSHVFIFDVGLRLDEISMNYRRDANLKMCDLEKKWDKTNYNKLILCISLGKQSIE